MVEALRRGDRIELRGFGAFTANIFLLSLRKLTELLRKD
jgi:hypothetical protein